MRSAATVPRSAILETEFFFLNRKAPPPHNEKSNGFPLYFVAVRVAVSSGVGGGSRIR